MDAKAIQPKKQLNMYRYTKKPTKLGAGHQTKHNKFFMWRGDYNSNMLDTVLQCADHKQKIC